MKILIQKYNRMKTKELYQKVKIKASPAKVYNAFMNEKQHQAFTGQSAKIENKKGGRFATCGDQNYGYTIFLDKGKRIIQAWTLKDFPDNRYSIIDITLNETNKGYTELNFHQSGIPNEFLKHLKNGWKAVYWKPLKAYLEKGIKQPLK